LIFFESQTNEKNMKENGKKNRKIQNRKKGLPGPTHNRAGLVRPVVHADLVGV
jgi:hypothetical protein